MSNKSKKIINADGVNFAKYNNATEKESEEDVTSKVNNENFDFNAKKNIKR
jgi:hypothetical protein